MYETPALERYGTFRELTMTAGTAVQGGTAVLHHGFDWGWNWGGGWTFDFGDWWEDRHTNNQSDCTS